MLFDRGLGLAGKRQVAFRPLAVAEAGQGEAELVVPLDRLGFDGDRSGERVPGLLEATLLQPGRSDRHQGRRVIGIDRESTVRESGRFVQVAEPLDGLGHGGQRLHVAGLQPQRRGQCFPGLVEPVHAVEREPEPDVGQGPTRIQGRRLVEYLGRLRHLAYLHAGHAEQVGVLRLSGVHASQRLERQDRLDRVAPGEGEAGVGVQDVFGVGRQGDGAAERFGGGFGLVAAGEGAGLVEEVRGRTRSRRLRAGR